MYSSLDVDPDTLPQRTAATRVEISFAFGAMYAVVFVVNISVRDNLQSQYTKKISDSNKSLTFSGGSNRIRTYDPLLVGQVL